MAVNNLRKFLKQQSGAVAIIMAMMIVLLVGVAGSGVDFGHTFLVRNKMSQAIDAAALAAALMEPGTPEEERRRVAKRVFQLNYTDSDPDIPINPDDLNISFKPDGNNPKTVAIDVSAPVDTVFLSLMGIGSITAPASVEVAARQENEINDIDITVVIDGTGSMSNSKTILTEALNNFINKFANVSQKWRVRFSFVEYNSSIKRTMDWTSMEDVEKIREWVNAYSTNGTTDGGLGAQRGKDYVLDIPPRPEDNKKGATTAFVFMTDGQFNSPNEATSETNFLSACDEIKAENVLSYTIGYTSAVKQELLRECASNPKENYYFYASTGDALSEAFNIISGELSGIRITK